MGEGELAFVSSRIFGSRPTARALPVSFFGAFVGVPRRMPSPDPSIASSVASSPSSIRS